MSLFRKPASSRPALRSVAGRPAEPRPVQMVGNTASATAELDAEALRLYAKAMARRNHPSSGNRPVPAMAAYAALSGISPTTTTPGARAGRPHLRVVPETPTA